MWRLFGADVASHRGSGPTWALHEHVIRVRRCNGSCNRQEGNAMHSHSQPSSALGRPALAAVARFAVALSSLVALVPNAARAQAQDPAICPYFYEWIQSVLFPLQPDPHAAYTYFMPNAQAAEDGIAFVTEADFPFGAWTSWLAYT